MRAERAASLWPNKGEEDLRPPQGQGYRRLDPIAPAHPVVPAGAPAALDWHANAETVNRRDPTTAEAQGA